MGRATGFVIQEGIEIEFKRDAEPRIQWTHIDGPVLYARNCQMHWLTLWERFQFAMGWMSERDLERKHWPDFHERWEQRVTDENWRDYNRRREERRVQRAQERPTENL